MSALSAYYQERAAAFIKTAVCFDDKAEYRSTLRKNGESLTATKADDGFSASRSTPTETVGKPVEVEVPSGDELDARALTEAFAEKGILCSVIIPHASAEAVTTQISTLTKSADITILDWKLDKITPRNAIVKIAEDDNACGGKLRLIIIYSDANPVDVMTELADAVKVHGFVLDEKTHELSGPHARIVFFSKPGAAVPLGKVVKYEELPNRAVKEFTKLTSGLLPAAALSAITEVREQTHHLLATFPATLDGAFIAHRCLVPDPNDAEQFLIDIFEGEIGSLLKHNGIGKSVNAERCIAWIVKEKLCGPEKSKLLENVLSNYDLKKKDSFRKLFEDSQLEERKISEKILELLYKNAPTHLIQAQIDLSLLSSLDAHSQSSIKFPPRLQFGTLVKEGGGATSRYLMCMQPLCDSVRIKHTTGKMFPFIALHATDSVKDDGILDLCIMDGKKVVWLTAKATPSFLETHNFIGKSKKEQFVEAELKEDSYFFNSGKRCFKWLGELRIGKAQRIASQLAARIHTLGIDEFEWLRLHQRQAG
ncbi:MAG: hypothetical protein KGZ62_05500 [Sulfurimonas sp.]|nr:hypothetical protein [Sulfurimonas sp.]